MPIINLEYTANLEISAKIKSFLLEIHHLLVQEIKTDLRTCRSSISKCTDYVIADGSPENAYIILRLKILPGRPEEVKNRTGKMLLEKIRHHFSSEIKKFDTQVRVALNEVDKQHYHGLD